MSIKITYFVHGTTTDNEQGIATGILPGKLSELGLKQSKKLRKILKYKHFDIVFCSDLKRSIDSANISFADKYKIIQDKRLRECDYGDFNGKPVKQFKIDIHRHINIPYKNGENYKDVEKRIGSFIDFLKENYDNKNIAIVSHHAPQLAFEVLLNEKTWKQAIDEDWRKTKSWQPGWKYIIR